MIETIYFKYFFSFQSNNYQTIPSVHHILGHIRTDPTIW
jgi:hypothetical protein